MSDPEGNEEVRSVSSTGAEKGTKLARFDLIPAGPLRALALHYGIGASKYADRNWERGYEWSKSYAALSRHLNAWWGGEDLDPEFGDSHMVAVAWHAIALLEYLETHPEFDDRPTTIHRREDAGLAGTEGDFYSEPATACELDCDECAQYEAERHAEQAAEIKSGDAATLDDWQDLGYTKDGPFDGSVWIAPLPTVALTAFDVPLETIALATGTPIEQLRMPDYSKVTVKPEDLDPSEDQAKPPKMVINADDLQLSEGSTFRPPSRPLPDGTQVLVRRQAYQEQAYTYFHSRVEANRWTPDGWQYWVYDIEQMRDLWVWREDLYIHP